MPVDADEPPEKRMREEEIAGEGIILPFSLSVSFHGLYFHVLICFPLLLFLFLFSRGGRLGDA